ncbi:MULTISPECIES: hypothetical protein [Methylosinus]|uniref:Uncharacterized protein n=1 Tax=Methylosinus sporium TaxID=428 RepID=A0A2U1SUE1_METSR|nr:MULTISPECIES: hypothetical protein [Methylosinus]MBU3890670.1 hypothetical protein [Methylosinus sp. KRF6]PWB95228.1 hypothetical protein C5689_03545 [Methylosinus sporium]TRL37203.1 hypothetical protein FM996_03215 [Methylosinus sporium]
MGELIDFSARARPAAAAPPIVGEAQILFFLGVRYVRPEEAATKTPGGGGKASSGGRKRKRRA